MDLDALSRRLDALEAGRLGDRMLLDRLLNDAVRRRRSTREPEPDLVGRLSPGTLTGGHGVRGGRPDTLPDLGSPLLARLRDDASMGAYTAGGTDAFGGFSNLLADPTFESVTTTPTTIGTAYTSLGDEWEAKYVLNSGTVATTRQLYEADPRQDLQAQGSSSTVVLYLEFGLAASDMTIYLRPKDVTEVLSTANAIASWLVGSCRAWAGDTFTIATFTCYLEIVDGSDTVLAQGDAADLIQLRAIHEQSRIAAAFETPVFSDDYRWRLRVDVTKTDTGATGYAIGLFGEPMIAQSEDGSPPMFTPAIGRWEPSHASYLDVDGTLTAALLRLTGTTVGAQVLGVRDDGDSVDRWAVTAGGNQEWGPGSGARDAILSRDSAGVMLLDDAGLRVQRDTAGSLAFGARVTGDSVPRHFVGADGEHQWGSGSATRDVRMRRSAANILEVDNGAAGAATLSVVGGVDTGTGVFSGAVSALTSLGIGTYAEFNDAASVSSPSSGFARIYFDTDGHLYMVNSAGDGRDLCCKIIRLTFVAQNVPASATTSMNPQDVDTPVGTPRVNIPKSGWVVGVARRTSAVVAAGNIDVRVTLGGTEVWTALDNISSSATSNASQAPGLDSFTSSDGIGVNLVSDGTYAPATLEWIVDVYVQVPWDNT